MGTWSDKGWETLVYCIVPCVHLQQSFTGLNIFHLLDF